METAFLLPLFIAAALVMAGILVSPLSSRIGMPVLLLFLAVGMLAGQDGPGNIVFHRCRRRVLTVARRGAEPQR